MIADDTKRVVWVVEIDSGRGFEIDNMGPNFEQMDDYAKRHEKNFLSNYKHVIRVVKYVPSDER